MSAASPWLALLLACADKGSPAGGPAGTDSGEPVVDPFVDQALFEGAIAGARDPAQALAQIADQGGLPVLTDRGSYYFGCLCGAGDWELVGDHDGWAGAPLATAGELRWIEVEIPEPVESLYKYRRGEAYTADPLARRFGYDDFGEHSIVRSEAAHLERWVGLTDGALARRDLTVHVPAGGVFTHALYAHDGQNLFDPGAMWGGWRLQESLPENMLVVGIFNTSDRMEEYTHTTDTLDGEPYGGEGDAYADLVEGVIRPRMEAAYGEAAVVGTMGSSLGGLISLHLALRHPGRYDMAISLSGTMGWGSIEQHNPTMIERYAEAGHGQTALYLDSGGSGDCFDGDGDGIEDDDPSASDNYCENLQLRDTLAEVGYTFDEDLFHWWEPEAPHNEAAWAARVERPLSLFAAR